MVMIFVKGCNVTGNNKIHGSQANEAQIGADDSGSINACKSMPSCRMSMDCDMDQGPACTVIVNLIIQAGTECSKGGRRGKRGNIVIPVARTPSAASCAC